LGKFSGEFINKYRKSHGIELADSLIAACCKAYEFKLWTLNKKTLSNDKRGINLRV